MLASEGLVYSIESLLSISNEIMHMKLFFEVYTMAAGQRYLRGIRYLFQLK